jgi:hypothetical protein
MRLEARDWVSCCDTHLQGCCRGASVGGTRRKKERRTRLREGVWSAVPWERGERGFAYYRCLDLQTSHRNHRQWGAAPFTLAPTLTL